MMKNNKMIPEGAICSCGSPVVCRHLIITTVDDKPKSSQPVKEEERRYARNKKSSIHNQLRVPFGSL